MERNIAATSQQDLVHENRPWGEYTVLANEKDFKAKVIVVHPHQKLSYQSHSQREEHWVVVSGKGQVTLNDIVHPVAAGTYIHIPKEAKHRIHNTSDSALKFVEVQLGSYFGEDDIKRYQDDYGRV